jgi:hypothetical protein
MAYRLFFLGRLSSKINCICAALKLLQSQKTYQAPDPEDNSKYQGINLERRIPPA